MLGQAAKHSHAVLRWESLNVQNSPKRNIFARSSYSCEVVAPTSSSRHCDRHHKNSLIFPWCVARVLNTSDIRVLANALKKSLYKSFLWCQPQCHELNVGVASSHEHDDLVKTVLHLQFLWLSRLVSSSCCWQSPSGTFTRKIAQAPHENGKNCTEVALMNASFP